MFGNVVKLVFAWGIFLSPHSIDQIDPFHVETGDLVTVKVSDFFFGNDATVQVIFFHMEAGSRVVDATATHESLVPDQSASVRVPASLAFIHSVDRRSGKGIHLPSMLTLDQVAI